MIRRFEWIRGCGYFEDYRWDDSLPNFARINVVYGNNGAGKTSLARALDGLRSDPIGYSRVSLAVEDTGGARFTEGNDDPLFDRVFVFSESFVERNHQLNTESADMSAVLTLGERSVEVERQLEALRPTAVTKTEEAKAARERVLECEADLEKAHAAIAEKVVAALSRAGGRYRSRANYRVDVVARAFAGSRDWVLLSDHELEARLALVQSDNRSSLATHDQMVEPPAGFAERVSAALGMTPATMILDTLEAHPQASSWVQEGQLLHEGIETCIFCGSSLSTERKSQIEQHFSDQVSRLQAELQAIIGELDRLDEGAAAAVAGAHNPDLLFSDLRAPYGRAAASLRDQCAVLDNWTTAVRRRVEAKLGNVLAGDSDPVPQPPPVERAAIAAVTALHNERVDQHAALVQSAAREVEHHYLKEAEQGVDDLVQAQSSLGAAADRLTAELCRLQTAISALENVESDPVPSANVLTAEVARLLGRSELRFEAVDGRYSITRDGAPAVGLSVGERKALALVHFLELVARSVAAGGKAIVFIDDPVSSLDSDTFMGMSTYLWSECVTKDHVAQVILATHNFEMFRQWDIQLEMLRSSSEYPSQLYELRSYHETTAGQPKRRPRLAVWPPSASARKKLRSSYHHAFVSLCRAKQVLDADDSLEHRLDAQLLFPNVIRRMLETFLAFKRPEWVGNFTSAMRNSANLLRESGYEGDADALRHRLTRYAHAYSHSETPATDLTVSPDEARTAIGAVFTFMKQLDEAHFAGLCEVLGVDARDLVACAGE